MRYHQPDAPQVNPFDPVWDGYGEIDLQEAEQAASDSDGADEYCICAGPNLGLCGAELDPDDPPLPDAEVPDELTCPKCLKIQREGQS